MKRIMIAFGEGGGNGGPNNSHLRIMNSGLSKEYEFIPLIVPKGKKGLFNKKLKLKIAKQIIDEKPDAVHIIGLEMIGYYLVKACKTAKVKTIIMAIHGSTTEAIEFNKNYLKRKMALLIEIFTLRNVNYTYGVSKYVGTIPHIKKYARNYYGHIYNMMLENEKATSDKDTKEEFGFSKDDIVVVSTGRITKEKGFDTLTDIIINYKNRDNVKFLIAGDGNYFDEMRFKLKEQIDDGQVVLTGYIQDVSQVLKAGDIFVMASRHETLCMSLIEAGQYGLALVASNVGGMKEVVDSTCGFLVGSEDKDGFISAIDKLIDDKKLRNRLKKGAKELMISKFNNEETTQKLRDLYKNAFWHNNT